MNLRINALMVSTAVVAIMAPGAFGQEGDNPFSRGRYTAVTERSQPEFDPLPVRAGVFEVEASIGVSEAYNDNIFAEPNNEDDDSIIRLRPQVDARSTWSSHEVAMGASVDHSHYLNEDNDSENATDYNVYLNGRLDVTRTFALRAGVDSQHVTEQRYEPASIGAPEPAAFDRYGVFAGASYRVDRVQLDATVGIREQEYDQVAQQQRDNTDAYINARASYAVSPDVAVFVQGRRSELDYSQSNRDGSRTTVDIGVNFELAAPFRGEIAVGSFQDERDVFADTSGLSVAANVQWFPTQLTTVTFEAFRGATDPGLATSATAVTSSYGVRVDHELYRNVLLYGGLRMENNTFEGAIDREDDTLAGWVGAAWKLNRHAHLEAMYSGRSQDSSGTGAGPDLDQNVLSVGVRFFP